MQWLHQPLQGHATDALHQKRRPFPCRKKPGFPRCCCPPARAFFYFGSRFSERSGSRLCPFRGIPGLQLLFFAAHRTDMYLSNFYNAKPAQSVVAINVNESNKSSIVSMFRPIVEERRVLLKPNQRIRHSQQHSSFIINMTKEHIWHCKLVRHVKTLFIFSLICT